MTQEYLHGNSSQKSLDMFHTSNLIRGQLVPSSLVCSSLQFPHAVGVMVIKLIPSLSFQRKRKSHPRKKQNQFNNNKKVNKTTTQHHQQQKRSPSDRAFMKDSIRHNISHMTPTSKA